MFCLVMIFSQPLHAYTISSGGDKIYTSVQSVIFKTYEGDVSGDPNDLDLRKMTVFEFVVSGKIWSDLFEITNITYGGCDLGVLITPSFDNSNLQNRILEIEAETCLKDRSFIIHPEFNYFDAVGFLYLDITSVSTLPDGEYDLSFLIEGIPPKNHGHSILTTTNTGNSLFNHPDPKGWGIDTGVSFDLSFPSSFLLMNLFAIPIICRFRKTI